MSTKQTDIDISLFQRIGSGDQIAFKQLLEIYRPTVYGQAMAYLKDVQKAEDVVQEVFMVIWYNRQQLVDMDNPLGYLLTVARNKIIDEFRKKLPLAITDSVERMVASSDASALKTLEHKQLWQLIERAIEEMPPQQKKVFRMSKKEGLKYHEIAGQLQISRETVKIHMVRALAFIRGFINDHHSILIFLFILPEKYFSTG